MTQNANTKKLRVAVIGLGKMGLLHSSLLSVFPNVDLVAICDKSRLMRALAKSTLKKPLVTDDLSLLSDLNLDVVYVTTPIPSHYSIIKEIYSKSIAPNLFVEKTLSSTFPKSEEICKLAQGSNGLNMVGYMKRFSVTFKKAKEFLGQKMLGEVLSFEAYAFSSDFAEVAKNSSISAIRGGVLVDLGAHVADLALWFFGDLHVNSALTKLSPAVGSVDSATFEVTGANSLFGKFEISWTKTGYRLPEFGLTIKGTKGNMTVDDNRVKLYVNNSKLVEWYRQDLFDLVPFLLAEPEYFRENESFIGSIIGGIEIESNFRSALKVDNLLGEVERKANA